MPSLLNINKTYINFAAELGKRRGRGGKGKEWKWRGVKGRAPKLKQGSAEPCYATDFQKIFWFLMGE